MIERMKAEILLNLWRAILLWKLRDIQLIEKFHIFYGTGMFITCSVECFACLSPDPLEYSLRFPIPTL
jgi:hypothetical protein